MSPIVGTAPARAITLGAGKGMPQGRSQPLIGAPVKALADAIAGHGGAGAWWSASTFEDSYREGSRWRGASAIVLDLDYHDADGEHAAIPPAVAARAAEALSTLPNLIHDTPRGLHAVFVLADPITDAETFLRAGRGAEALAAAALGDLIRPREGLTIDPVVTKDRARFLWTSGATVAGQKRTAEVRIVRPIPWRVEGLVAKDSEDTLISVPRPANSMPSLPDRIKRASAYLARIPGAVSGEGGHKTTWGAALSVVRGFSLPPDVGYDLLAREYNLRCSPPWTEKELRHKIEDAAKAGVAEGYLLNGRRNGDHEYQHLPAQVTPAEPTSPAMALAEPLGLVAEDHVAAARRLALVHLEGGADVALTVKRVSRVCTNLSAEEIKLLVESVADTLKAVSGAAVGEILSPAEALGFPWPDPIPLDAVQVEEFPIDALPEWLGNWVKATADANQIPLDLPAMLALSVLASAGAKKFDIEARPGWIEPVNIMVAVVLPPGERKSAAFAVATAPIIDFERAHASAWRADFERARAAFEIAQKTLEKAKKEALEGDTQKDRALVLAAEFAGLRAPVFPRLFVDDVTPERLVSMLAEQGGRLSVLSAEGVLFNILAGRYADGAACFEGVLKGHSGDTLRVDRVGRAPDIIDSPALTVGVTIQPDVLRSIGERGEFKDRGLVARFLICVPIPRVGRREVARPPVPKEVAAIYGYRLRALLEMPIEIDPTGRALPRRLKLSEEGELVLRRFEAALEPRLGAAGDLGTLGGWGSKLSGALVRISALLHLSDVATVQGFGHIGHPPGHSTTEISGEIVRKAGLIAHFLIPHARRAATLMGDPGLDLAGRVLAAIVAQKEPRCSKREIFRKLRGGLRGAADLDAPLQLLVDHGWIRPSPGEPEPRPGRPSKTFDVHPSILRGETSGNHGQNGQNLGGVQ